MIAKLTIRTNGQGLYEVNDSVAKILSASSAAAGLCTVFLQHTSASLLIQENADPTAKRDLEHWLARLVPERDSLFTHTLEGPDDMPAHIKAALTQTSLHIPFQSHRLLLGTWQGIYLWEHRKMAQNRSVIVQLLADILEN